MEQRTDIHTIICVAITFITENYAGHSVIQLSDQSLDKKNDKASFTQARAWVRPISPMKHHNIVKPSKSHIKLCRIPIFYQIDLQILRETRSKYQIITNAFFMTTFHCLIFISRRFQIFGAVQLRLANRYITIKVTQSHSHHPINKSYDFIKKNMIKYNKAKQTIKHNSHLT